VGPRCRTPQKTSTAGLPAGCSVDLPVHVALYVNTKKAQELKNGHPNWHSPNGANGFLRVPDPRTYLSQKSKPPNQISRPNPLPIQQLPLPLHLRAIQPIWRTLSPGGVLMPKSSIKTSPPPPSLFSAPCSPAPCFSCLRTLKKCKDHPLPPQIPPQIQCKSQIKYLYSTSYKFGMFTDQ